MRNFKILPKNKYFVLFCILLSNLSGNAFSYEIESTAQCSWMGWMGSKTMRNPYGDPAGEQVDTWTLHWKRNYIFDGWVYAWPVDLSATNGWTHQVGRITEYNIVGWPYGYDVQHAGVTYGSHYIYRNGVWIYLGGTKAGTCNETNGNWNPNLVNTSSSSTVHN